jgi:hypothetical protein
MLLHAQSKWQGRHVCGKDREGAAADNQNRSRQVSCNEAAAIVHGAGYQSLLAWLTLSSQLQCCDAWACTPGLETFMPCTIALC